MSELSEAQKQLKIQKGIRLAEDELVTAIQEVLNDKSSYNELEESQFRNLVKVADSTDSTEVIKNFILYQVGRDKKWGRGKNSLANKIIHDIDNTIKRLANKIKIEAKVDDVNPILLELTRRYLGYGARYLVYKNKGEF